MPFPLPFPLLIGSPGPHDHAATYGRTRGGVRTASRLRPVGWPVRALLFGAYLFCTSDASPAQETAQEPGTVEVHVIDATTGRPLAGANVSIRQHERAGLTDASGRVELENLPARPHTLSVDRLGYVGVEEIIEIAAGALTRVEIALRSSPIQVGGLVVTGTARERHIGDVYRPIASLSGLELQRSLASSVPATLQGVPGFASQYNGPGASSPTIRGMSGDRVLVLEDGRRTGDLYQSASDHGVMVEPISADRMEVVRGPASLLYGSNALGGVVNVIRDEVPRSRATALTGTFSSQFESVNVGASGGLVLRGPLGPLAFRAEGTVRHANDTRTPLGRLDKTDMSVYNLAAGLSWVQDWGFVGAALRHYDNVYGVPGEFDGELIPGGHPGGVDIDVSRTSGRVRAAYQRPLLDFFESVELDGSVTRYRHDEIEGVIDGHVIVGSSFDQTSVDASILAHHDHALHDHPAGGLRAEGTLGLSVQSRELVAGGTQPGTRSADEWAVALFGYEEFTRGPVRLQAGARLDYRSITPASLDSLRVRTEERRISKPVRARSFSSLSGSLAALWDLAQDWTLGASLARSFRNPSIEELYSEGPHLADFSFDIGSPDLDTEIGLGADLFLRANRPQLSVELAAYYNRMQNFIFYAQTGETVRVIREGAPPRLTPVFEAQGEDADFLGGEGRVQWEAYPRIVLDATASYTRATRRTDSDPLPFIPPLAGRLEVRYDGPRFFGSVGADLSAAQQRVPHPIEVGGVSALPQMPTSGYGLLNAGLGFRHQSPQFGHTISLQANNITNREWRDHLSRIKDIAPQPGRNLQLTYRVHF